MSVKKLLQNAKTRRWLSVAGAGYLVVFVFAVGYVLAAKLGAQPSTDNQGTPLGPDTRIAVGVLLAAPLAVAFLWDRVRTLKMPGVEITLSEATIDVPTLGYGAPEDAIAATHAFSGREDILEQISNAINAPDRQVLEINLRSQPYWWSTRLYLESALLVDRSQVQCLVFVDGDASRRYVGTTTPRLVRDALVESRPCLETIFQSLSEQNLSVEQLIHGWIGSVFDGQSEHDIKVLVDRKELRKLLGTRLEMSAVRRSEHEGSLLHYQILSRGERFVPVVRDNRLERVVDADALARRWSLALLERKLA